MSDAPDQDDELDTEPANLRRIGLGTISIMVVFFAIISLMCLASVVILAVLFFRTS